MPHDFAGLGRIWATLLVVAVVSPRPAHAGDWPSWRGPQHNGHAAATTFPEAWPIGRPAPTWQAPLAAGWSSPIVAAGRVFATDRDGALERTAAFDAATGKLLWQAASAVDFDPHEVGRRHGNGPKATPVYAEGRVYTLGIAGMLHCYNAVDGTVVWKHNLPAEFAEPRPLPEGRAYVEGEDCVVVPIGAGQGAPVPLFGYTGSPVVAEGLLITAVGGKRGGTIMAFDAATGAVVWKALDENPSYSSPVVADIGGVRQVVVATGPQLVGLEIKTGKLLWSVPYQNQYDETIGTPVVAGDMVLLSAVGRPLSAWRVEAIGGAFQAREIWQVEDLSSYLSSVVVVADHVYGMNDGGEWVCVKLADGTIAWRGGNHGYYSTPVVAGDRLIGLNEKGALAILAATPAGYRELAQNQLVVESTWTSPAVVGNRLYIRSRAGLACFEIK